jgi:hypothetical protein
VWDNVEDEATVDGREAEEGDNAREVTDIEQNEDGSQMSRLCDETEAISLENVPEVASASTSPRVARGTKRARASKAPRERKKPKRKVDEEEEEEEEADWRNTDLSMIGDVPRRVTRSSTKKS